MTINQSTSQPPGTEQQMSAAEQAAPTPTPPEHYSWWNSPVRYKMNGWRIACGILWSVYTLIWIVCMFAAPGGGHLGGFVLASLTGFYAFRIWTCRSKHLLFWIIIPFPVGG